MKFRVVKTGWLSYDAQVTENGYEWITLDNFFTKRGAVQKCIGFAEFCNKKHNEPKGKTVDEFEIHTERKIDYGEFNL